MIKWSGINRPLVLLTFPTETSSASRTSRAPNRQTLWRTLASNHLLPQLVISQSQDRDQIHCGHSRFQVCPLSLSHSKNPSTILQPEYNISWLFMQTAISCQYFDGQEHLEGFGQLKERRPSAGLIDCNAALAQVGTRSSVTVGCFFNVDYYGTAKLPRATYKLILRQNTDK